MIQRISDRLHREDKGFTLIELMVVVLIIAILIAIAIPTFLGARRRAQDRAAQSSLRNGVTAAKTIFTDNEDYSLATEAKLDADEPALAFNPLATDNSTEPTMVSFNSGASVSTRFVAAVYSKSTTCWFIQDVTAAGAANAGTTWNVADSAGGVGCNAGAAPAQADASWKKNVGDLVVP